MVDVKRDEGDGRHSPSAWLSARPATVVASIGLAVLCVGHGGKIQLYSKSPTQILFFYISYFIQCSNMKEMLQINRKECFKTNIDKTKVYKTRFFYPSHSSATRYELYRNMRVEACHDRGITLTAYASPEVDQVRRALWLLTCSVANL